MTPARIRALRRSTGWMSALLLSAIALAVLDGLVSQARREFNTFDALPGQRLEANGPMPAGAADSAEVIVEGQSDEVRLELGETGTSFWFGGLMWRGTVVVDAVTEPGRYHLSLRGQQETVAAPDREYAVRVFADEAQLREHSTSYAVRFLGLHPFLLAGELLPLALLGMAGSFFLSKHLERAMAKEGKAEIYMVKKSPEGCLVSFSLGTIHGIRTGERLDILNENGLTVAQADVEQSGRRDSVARVLAAVQIEVGYLVSRQAPRG